MSFVTQKSAAIVHLAGTIDHLPMRSDFITQLMRHGVCTVQSNIHGLASNPVEGSDPILGSLHLNCKKHACLALKIILIFVVVKTEPSKKPPMTERDVHARHSHCSVCLISVGTLTFR